MSLLILISFLIPGFIDTKYLASGGTRNFVHLTTPGDSFRIGFGSCYDEYQKGALPENNLMKDIAKESLDLWIWLGDFAYVDNKSLVGEKRSLLDKLKHLSVL